jgi:large subunit ribosomal protein L10
MALSKAKKTEILERVREIVSASPSVIFVNFHGLGVEETNAMRVDLREKGVRYLVAKKTLVRKALEGVSFEGEVPELDGELALVYGEELTTPASAVYKFQKEYEDRVSILGGVFDGQFKDKPSMMEIATIPSLDVLRGQFVQLINSPLQQFAMVLDQIAGSKESA